MVALIVILHRVPVSQDIIRFERVGPNFMVEYIEEGCVARFKQMYTKELVKSYMYTLLYSVVSDLRPPRQIEILGPGFPPVTYAIGDLDPWNLTWTSILSIMFSFAEGHWTLIPREDASPPEQSHETAASSVSHSESATPQSESRRETRSSSLQPGDPRNSEQVGEGNLTAESSSSSL